MEMARPSETAPWAFKCQARSLPGTYSMTMKRLPSSSSPESNTCTVLGCESRATTRASWRKRALMVLSRAWSGRSRLSAATLPMRTCSTL